jgi:RNA polymerase sigma factor (sigma-70 family)
VQKQGSEKIRDLHAESNTTQEADANIEIEKLRQYLKILNRREREIIIMRLWDGLSYSEISRILGKSTASCEMMLARTVAKIRIDIAAIITIIFIQFLN